MYKPADVRQAIGYLKSVELLSPTQLDDRLLQMGYVGQSQARRALCLMAYCHLMRLRQRFLSPEKKPLRAKRHTLLIGPTGCGKTHMLELLFGKILGLPVIVEDLAEFTSAGVYGRSVSEIPFRLLEAARGNAVWAMMGICVLDEFDKIAAAKEGGRDPGGVEIQHELLKFIEGKTVTDERRMRKGMQMSTGQMAIVACGAFDGLRRQLDTAAGFGFGNKNADDNDPVSGRVTAQDIVSYGFMPELVGRFTGGTVELSSLDRKSLRQILVDNILPLYQKEFDYEGMKLPVKTDHIERMVEAAFTRGTGARGLEVEVNGHLTDIAFEQFGKRHETT